MPEIPSWKIRVPVRAGGWVTRRRLLDRLHRTSHLPVALVLAPAGYGKTSLLAEFAGECPYPMAWLSLDDGDTDLGSFVESLTQSLSHAVPGLGERALAASRHATSVAQSRLSFVGTLVDEIASTPEFVGFVLDDWQRVDTAPEVVATVQLLVDRLPPNGHLYLAARSRPSLNFTGRVAQQELAALGWRELAFSNDEAKLLLARPGSTLVEAEIEALVEAAEGWVMGMLLTAESGAIPALGQIRSSNTPLAAYLARVVFDDLTHDEQQLLYVASLLEPISAARCDDLLARHDSARLLEALANRRLVDATESGWRLHHLISGYVQDRLAATEPDRNRSLRRQLAELELEGGDPASAIDHLLAIDDHERAIGILRTAGFRIGEAGHWHAVVRWLTQLPKHLIGRDPELLELWARAEIQVGTPGRALELAARAVAVAEERADPADLARARVMYAYALLRAGSAAAAVELCDQALASPAALADARLSAEGHRVRGLALVRLGHFPPALEQLQTALTLYESSGDLPNMAFTLNAAGTAWNSLGRVDEATANYRRALALRETLGDVIGAAVVSNNLARLHFQRGELPEAIALLTQAIATDERIGDPRALAAHLPNLGDAFRAAGQYERASDCYHRALSSARRVQYTIGIVDALDGLARLARIDGNLKSAERLAREALGEAQTEGSVYLRGVCELTLGAIACERGETATALDHFARGRALMAMAGQREGQARAALGTGLTHFRAGSLDPAIHSLLEATAIAEEMGAYAFLAIDSLMLEPLLQAAIAKGSRSAALPRILEDATRLANLRACQTDGEPEATRPRLLVRAFGPGEVVVDGKAIDMMGWPRHRARELFFAIATGPEPATRSDLGLALWPDVSEAQFSSQWRSTLYAMRSTIGPGWVQSDRGRYCLLNEPNAEIWCDVQIFQQSIARGQAQSGANRAAAYSEAVAVVSGPFLSTSNSPWAGERRLTLESQYDACLSWLVTWAVENGIYADIITYGEKLVARDDDLDTVHALIVRSYLELQQPLLAVQHYRNFVRRAHRRGAEPSPELASLHLRASALLRPLP